MLAEDICLKKLAYFVLASFLQDVYAASVFKAIRKHEHDLQYYTVPVTVIKYILFSGSQTV